MLVYLFIFIYFILIYFYNYLFLFVYVLASALISVLKDSENPPVHFEKYVVLHIPTCKLWVETISRFQVTVSTCSSKTENDLSCLAKANLFTLWFLGHWSSGLLPQGKWVLDWLEDCIFDGHSSSCSPSLLNMAHETTDSHNRWS